MKIIFEKLLVDTELFKDGKRCMWIATKSLKYHSIIDVNMCRHNLENSNELGMKSENIIIWVHLVRKRLEKWAVASLCVKISRNILVYKLSNKQH